MHAGELLRILLRWVHLLAAVVWIGGAILLLAAVRPAAHEGSAELQGSFVKALQARYRDLVEGSIIVLVVTGGLLTFDRLSGPGSSVPYAALLTLKVTLAVWMFYLAYRMRRRGRPRRARAEAGDRAPPAEGGGAAAAARPGASAAPTAARGFAPVLVLVLGILVLLLSEVLRTVYGSL